MVPDIGEVLNRCRSEELCSSVDVVPLKILEGFVTAIEDEEAATRSIHKENLHLLEWSVTYTRQLFHKTGSERQLDVFLSKVVSDIEFNRTITHRKKSKRT